jgi:alkylation response protein AidB-like acyl-CoA dehydrogenase
VTQMTAKTQAAESVEQFRRRLAGSLAEHHPGRAPRGSKRERTDWQRQWSATLFDHGLAGPAWSAEWGGMALDLERQIAYYEEIERHGCRDRRGTGRRSPDRRSSSSAPRSSGSRYPRPMLRGDRVWAQGFSEPEAGSDLPALRTTTRREGDAYVVNGQKIWSSHVDIADMMITLVRTGTQASRSAGITYLLVALDSPGITIRPIKDMAGTGTSARCSSTTSPCPR